LEVGKQETAQICRRAPPQIPERGLDTVRHLMYNDSWSVSDREFCPHGEREGSLSTAERRAREKAQRRREILDAARQEFFQRGFHRPTVDDVAACAEVSKGTIYLYFESKEEILAHLLLEGLDLLLNEMEAVCNPEPPSAECTLHNLADAYLAFCQSHPNYFRLIMAFDRGRFEESITQELHQQVLNKSLQGLTLVAQTIELGKSSGIFHVDDPWQAAGSVWAALNGVLVLMAHPLRQRLLRNDLETMFEATLDLILRGLKDGRD
jgi:AcrR family transcriptional regulator